MINRPLRLVSLLVLGLTSTAYATFPIEEIDCGIFDTDNPNFVGHNFGFGTELSYSSGTMTPVSTGFDGFVATPHQVAGVPDFVAGEDLPTGGQTLEELFGSPSFFPDSLNDGAIWQGIEGTGDLAGGFSEVTLSQRKRLSGDQTSGDFAALFALGKGYAPFEVIGGENGVVDVNLTIDLFSMFDYSGDGALSEGLTASLLNVTDPANAWLMDGVSGFYFAGDGEVSSSFTSYKGETQEDITDMFFSGPMSPDPDAPSFSSFFYTIETQLTEGQVYGLGLSGDGAVDLLNESTSWLDSSGTLLASIEVVTPGARLVLPGFAIPEPGTASFGARRARVVDLPSTPVTAGDWRGRAAA